MSDTVLVALISGAFMVVVASIEVVAAIGRGKARRERDKASEQEQAKEGLLVLLVESTGAAIALGEAAAHALQRGHTNGDTEAALKYAAEVKHKQKEFLAQQGVHAMY